MPTLLPLPFHKNWKIIINEFYDIDSHKESFDSDLKFYFMEDILEIKNIKNGTFIHLGWYPEFNPEGTFKIFISDTDYNGKIIEEFESKSKQEMVNELITAIKKYA
jgi:hypothetical protein